MRRGARYQEVVAQRLAANTRPTRSPEWENSRHRISHHRVPNLLFSQTRQRARLCNTAPARIVPFVSQVWNGRDSMCHRDPADNRNRAGSPRHAWRPPQTHNDSRPRSMSRSQSQQLRSAWSRSYPPNTFRGASTQIFSCESTIGAIGADGMPSGGTTSGIGPVDTGRISGCSTRVAISIAVKSNAPARK